ncbi:MAG: restriction endonuclease, partial [Halobacteriaceae archaeon]
MTEISRETIKQILFDFSESEFQKFIAQLLRLHGVDAVTEADGNPGSESIIKIHRPSSTPKQGIMFVAQGTPERLIGQATIRTAASYHLEHDNVFIGVITASTFSDTAQSLAPELNVKLINGDDICMLVEDQGDGKGLNFHEWKEEHPDYDYETGEGLDEAMQAFLQDALKMDKLEHIAKTGTRFLDNVVTMSDFPLEEIEEKVREMRKIGLGLMGFAQMLIQLGIRYGSEESQAAAKEVQRLITRWAVETSHQLAEERGTFHEWDKSKWASPTEHPEWFERYT